MFCKALGRLSIPSDERVKITTINGDRGCVESGHLNVTCSTLSNKSVQDEEKVIKVKLKVEKVSWEEKAQRRACTFALDWISGMAHRASNRWNRRAAEVGRSSCGYAASPPAHCGAAGATHLCGSSFPFPEP